MLRALKVILITKLHFVLERMLLEGVVRTSVEMLLFELQGAATGGRFRELAKLIK
jgi:hypothetical protein